MPTGTGLTPTGTFVRDTFTVRVQFRAYDEAGNVTTTKTRIWHRR